jgi:hypothetical protein
MQQEEDKIAAVTVQEDENGDFDATATTESGSVGRGYSYEGAIDPATPQDAVSDAVEDAK